MPALPTTFLFFLNSYCFSGMHISCTFSVSKVFCIQIYIFVIFFGPRNTFPSRVFHISSFCHAFSSHMDTINRNRCHKYNYMYNLLSGWLILRFSFLKNYKFSLETINYYFCCKKIMKLCVISFLKNYEIFLKKSLKKLLFRCTIVCNFIFGKFDYFSNIYII